MLEILKASLLHQYEAAVATLRACLAQCPDDKWQGNVGNFPFWHVAYHTLIYGDFYLSPSVDEFQPRDFHRDGYQLFDLDPETGEKPPPAEIPYERDVLLGYADFCRQKAVEIMAAETETSLSGPSGFPWYKVPRAEMWIINARHVHHHAAQLSLFLRRDAGVAIPWVGSGWREAE